MKSKIDSLTYFTNPNSNGFGYAVRYGLEKFSGDCVAIMMADLSDSTNDLVSFYYKMQEDDLDCVFGGRFIKGGSAINYPIIKKIINRMANLIIKVLIGIKYNDTTNAFKLYKKTTIDGLRPIISPHFNLTIELPLKAIIRGYSYEVIPQLLEQQVIWHFKVKNQRNGKQIFFHLNVLLF